MISRSVSSSSARPLRSIRQTLVRIVLACVLPAWLGIAVLIFGMYKVLGERAPEGALMTAHALVLAVDRELAIAQAALEALTASEVLAAGDFKAFRERALRVTRLYSFANIIVTRRTGQQVVNTVLPVDAKLPINKTAAVDDIVLAMSGKALDKTTAESLVKGDFARRGVERIFSKPLDIDELFIEIKKHCALDYTPATTSAKPLLLNRQ